jgi:DNA polymerase III delta subunit
MSAHLLLVHGDDGFGVDRAVAAFAERIGAMERTDIVPVASPDMAALDRAQLDAATMGMFGPRLAVLRQPLRAVGRSTAAIDRLAALIGELPDGGALALVETRPSRDITKPPALLKRISDAVSAAGGTVEERMAPRRSELAGWLRDHARSIGVAIEPPAAKLLSDRIGGAVWETDIERGEQTRVGDSELRKLATYAGERPITVLDVEALTTDTRPASVFAITNALDRRDAAAAAEALRRALEEGQPVLRIMASLEGRITDLIVARDLLAAGKGPAELTRAVGRGNARVAERVAEAARRYSAAELETMLTGLFEADLAIKANDMDPEPAISAWLGTYLLGVPRTRP